MEERIDAFPTALKIRLAVARDIEVIAQFDEFGGSRGDEAAAGVCIVGELRGAVVAYASYQPRGLLGQPLLTFLCVKNEHRRQGIASALVQAVQQVAVGRVLISSTEDWCTGTQRIFERLGWKQIGKISGVNKDASDELFYSVALNAVNSLSTASCD